MSEKKYIFLMVLPAIIVFLFLLVYPTIEAIINSFTNFSLTEGTKEFIWFGNYIRMFTTKRFWEALARTLIFVILSISISYIIGLFISVLLNKIDRGRNLYRIIFLIPMIIAPAITALNFKFMYNFEFGIINKFLNILSIPSIDFLGNPSISLFSVLAVDIWQGVPMVVLILLAGLESQPESVHEAGMIDGANVFQNLFYITLPLLKKFSVLVIIIRLMDSLKVYEFIYLMTGGGPGTSSETLNIYISKVAFSWFDIGYASALGLFLLYFIMFFINIIIKKTDIFMSKEVKI